MWSNFTIQSEAGAAAFRAVQSELLKRNSAPDFARGKIEPKVGRNACSSQVVVEIQPRVTSEI